MKRIAFISVAAVLAVSGMGLYYGAPSLLKEPLLHLNRSLSGMEEKTTTAALHAIHYLDSGAPSQPAPGNPSATPLVLLHGIFAAWYTWLLLGPQAAVSGTIVRSLPVSQGFHPLDRVVLSGKQMVAVLGILVAISLLIHGFKRYRIMNIKK